jgi:nucleotide-binding universal stress UspA family protein
MEDPMFTSIIVPLDRSSFAERALPLALAVAQRANAPVELVHVYEPTSHTLGAPVLDPACDEVERGRLRKRFAALAARLEISSHVPVTAAVLDGGPSEALRRHVTGKRSAIIIMATHGLGGMSRSWIGSVADAVVRHAQAPVLLVRPGAVGHAEAAGPLFRRVLVPLDGSDLAESVLAHALALGDAALDIQDATEYELFTVVRSPADRHRALPHRRPVHDEGDPGDRGGGVGATEHYLARLAAELEQCGARVHWRVVAHTHPAHAILEHARTTSADLIALATHGRGGLRRRLAGSVADEIMRGASTPVLISHPDADSAATAHPRQPAISRPA